MENRTYLREYQRMASTKTSADVPTLGELMERQAARRIVTAFTAWKLAGKPRMR